MVQYGHYFRNCFNFALALVVHHSLLKGDYSSATNLLFSAFMVVK